jgi:Cytochrome P450
MDTIWIKLATWVAVLVVGSAIASLISQRRSIKTMAGPGGWSFIGIGLSLPKNAPALFRKWAQLYGEVFKIRIGWYDWVIVNSPEAVKEIFDKQSIKTSSKAPLPYGHDLVSGGLRMFTMHTGPNGAPTARLCTSWYRPR